jgi:hypothetical protein
MTKTPEQLDNVIRLVKNHEDFSAFQKDPVDAGSVNLVAILSNMPKARIEKPNLLRVKNKMLDRISIPSESASDKRAWGLIFLRVTRIAGGIVGAFTIVLGLTLGTAVAALESIPGQPIYPVKKIVESVQLQMASTPEEKANLQIRFANTRVDELETILQRQKEGRASGEEVQKVVASTTRNLEETAKNITGQSEPQVNLLNKIVTLTNKQAAVIQSAQGASEGSVKEELDKALESTQTSKQQAIENIERAGLVVEDNSTITVEPDGKDTVTAEGQLTSVARTSVSVGTAQFTLTDETEYVNIKSDDLEMGMNVVITGEVKEKRTYATKIEVQPHTEPQDTDPADSEEDPPADSTPTDDNDPDSTEETVPLNP